MCRIWKIVTFLEFLSQGGWSDIVLNKIQAFLIFDPIITLWIRFQNDTNSPIRCILHPLQQQVLDLLLPGLWTRVKFWAPLSKSKCTSTSAWGPGVRWRSCWGPGLNLLVGSRGKCPWRCDILAFWVKNHCLDFFNIMKKINFYKIFSSLFFSFLFLLWLWPLDLGPWDRM